MTPLMMAAANGLLPMTEMLLQHGADLDAKTATGQTAWLLAGMNGHLDVVELFRKVRPPQPR